MSTASKRVGNEIKRKTLMEMQEEIKIKDPANMARLQVSELDKTMKVSLARVHSSGIQLENDRKELAHIEDQMSRIMSRYEPLCELIQANKAKKEQLLSALNTINTEERKITGESKASLSRRRVEDAKMLRRAASLELSSCRGFDVSLASTYRPNDSMMSTITSNPSQYLSSTMGKSMGLSYPRL